MIRGGEVLPSVVSELVDFWKKEIPLIFQFLLSDSFFLPFSELMEREIFTKKRHEKKVTFGDVKKVREVLMERKILRSLFFSRETT